MAQTHLNPFHTGSSETSMMMTERSATTSGSPRSLLRNGCLSFALTTLIACGNPGTSPDDEGEGPAPTVNLTGSITGQFGGQSEMQAWHVLLVERSSGISRITQVDAAGLYAFPGVASSDTYTLALASPDLVFSAVLSIPNEAPGSIRQYVSFESQIIPRLVFQGKVLSLQSLDNLRISNEAAVDSDSDGLPDGLDTTSTPPAGLREGGIYDEDPLGLHSSGESTAISASAAAEDSMDDLNPADGLGPSNELGLSDKLSLQNVDSDLDGVINSLDPDIDNDGIINILDSDDDNDQFPDIFDQDADGDLVPDNAAQTTDVYFPQEIQWFVPQVEIRYIDAATTRINLTMTTQLRDEATPSAVQMRGPESLFRGALVEVVDEAGTLIPQAWDLRLLDDGMSEDAGAGDRIFARRVVLSQLPRTNQIIAMQLVYQDRVLEFPYLFSQITTSPITTVYDNFLRLVQLTNNPFGATVTEFIWAVSVFDAQSRLVYTSEPIQAATERTHVIPEQVFEPGGSYTYSVVVQSLDAVPGYAPYRILSNPLPINPTTPAETTPEADTPDPAADTTAPPALTAP